ncbi:MAG: DUF1343 domain-containing protein [Bdellovibrionales bacterium]|nr:DUF1343 domain-containing protein [Bdellovibrionales bacterium]
MILGCEALLADNKKIESLKGKKIAMVVGPASVDSNLQSSFKLFLKKGLSINLLIGLQHGFEGDKQDNMIETPHDIKKNQSIPVYSLYSKTRRLNKEMLNQFDVLLFDIQDVGCRIYTYLTSLFYILEDCEKENKEVWVLDRPNPVGREVEGFLLQKELTSFVGAAPILLKHGLTLAEAALWYKNLKSLKINLVVIKMLNYYIDKEPWPKHLSWINPSPNLPRLSSTIIYPGSVLIEGTTLSEGRGTTRPLEIIGAPYLNTQKILEILKKDFLKYTKHCIIREMNFEPCFHKFKTESCKALQIHVDNKTYTQDFNAFSLMSVILKIIKTVHPKKDLWSKPPYEYEYKKMPIDLISGSYFLREWVDSGGHNNALEDQLKKDKEIWLKSRKDFLLY